MVLPRARFLDLLKARCDVFATTFNPDGLRLGNKILRKRLLGPSLASYYPMKVWSIKEMNKSFGPHVETFLDEDVERDEHLEERRSRGKQPPKKKKGPQDGKKRK